MTTKTSTGGVTACNNRTLKKWPPEVKQTVLDLRAAYKHGPKKLSALTGVPEGQIRFWLYPESWRATYQKRKTSGKISPSANAAKNSRRKYYREKYNDWEKWKAQTLRSSFLRLRKKFPESGEPPAIEEIRLWLSTLDFTCAYCLGAVKPSTFHVDHVQPISRGGKQILENLVCACKSCNLAKGALTEHEFTSLLQLLSTWADKGRYLLGRLKAGNYAFR